MNDHSMKLDGTSARVTGANRGLGKALVRALLAAGRRKSPPPRATKELDVDFRVQVHGTLGMIAAFVPEIFPDAMAKEMGALWRRDPEVYEQVFASF